MVSASRRWLMDTNKPKDIQVEIISATEISIMVANSLTVTNSVSLRILFSSSACSISACIFWCTASRLSLRCLELLVFPLFPKRANVSLICFCTSSSEISALLAFFFFIFFIFFLLSSCLAVLEISMLIFSSFFRIRFLFLRVSDSSESSSSSFITIFFLITISSVLLGGTKDFFLSSRLSLSLSCLLFFGGRVR